MIASTCLAVLFVPTFFVVIQRFENWLASRKDKAGIPSVEQAPGVTH
jgi:HAE1 family hydrophobic/amphiphilic exporter-1